MVIALVLDGNQVRANHACSLLRPLPDPKCRRNLGAQVGAAKPEFIDRACQRERLKSSHSEIFDQAKTHDSSPCSRAGAASAAGPGQAVVYQAGTGCGLIWAWEWARARGPSL